MPFKYKITVTIFIVYSLCSLHNTFVSAPALKLIDLPGIDQRSMDESMVSINKVLYCLFVYLFGQLVDYYLCNDAARFQNANTFTYCPMSRTVCQHLKTNEVSVSSSILTLIELRG